MSYCSLIEVDEKDQEMNRILFGMDSPDAERTTEERVDSPLGQTEDFTAMSEPAGSGPEIGPLPQKYSTNSQVPRISPPPGWDVARGDFVPSRCLSLPEYFFPFLYSSTLSSLKVSSLRNFEF